MTLDTLKNLAENVAPAAATEVLSLIGVGLRAKYPAAKPTMETDLQAAYASLQASYAALRGSVTAAEQFVGDLK